MNYIIGSGLVGLLARHILGDGWKIITQGRSRYYSFDPPLADNFIKIHDSVDDIVKSANVLGGNSHILYKRTFSFKGILTDSTDLAVGSYLDKIYNYDPPSLPDGLLKTSFFVYGLTAKQLHDSLQKRYMDELKHGVAKIEKIDAENRIINTNKENNLEYNYIINTIPLNALFDIAGVAHDLTSRSICHYHIQTSGIDIEGADESLVCDSAIEFYKVVKLDKDRYMFWSSDAIDNPHVYLGAFIGYDMDIIDTSTISGAFPLGSVPDLSDLEQRGVYCVGSNAQWDDFMDISSCINRLMKIKKQL